MQVSKQKIEFLNSPAAEELKAELSKMTASSKYNTEDSFTCSKDTHPDSKISFVEKHLEYIANHPDTNPRHYMANLRLKTRVIGK